MSLFIMITLRNSALHGLIVRVYRKSDEAQIAISQFLPNLEMISKDLVSVI